MSASVCNRVVTPSISGLIVIRTACAFSTSIWKFLASCDRLANAKPTTAIAAPIARNHGFAAIKAIFIAFIAVINFAITSNAGPTTATKPPIITTAFLSNASAALAINLPMSTINGITTGNTCCPSTIMDFLNSVIAWLSLKLAVSAVPANASSNMPVVSVMFWKIWRVVSTLFPIRSITPESARTLPNTDADAAALPSNFSDNVSNVERSPFSFICVRKFSDERPISVNASSAICVGRNSDVMIPRT